MCVYLQEPSSHNLTCYLWMLFKESCCSKQENKEKIMTHCEGSFININIFNHEQNNQDFYSPSPFCKMSKIKKRHFSWNLFRPPPNFYNFFSYGKLIIMDGSCHTKIILIFFPFSSFDSCLLTNRFRDLSLHYMHFY